MAYRKLNLDIINKSLVPDKSVIINKEFMYDSDSQDVRRKDSIRKYMPEESCYLLDDFELNKQEIINILHEYNHTKDAAYKDEIKFSERPFITCIEYSITVNIEKVLGDIKTLLVDKDNAPLPLRTFIGDTDARLTRRFNYPIFTVDDRYNIDQIYAINQGLKSPTSYLQGPPGTGKTQTLLNAILSSVMNNKTVLVTSNNNIPMDGVYEDILNLKYKNNLDLLFPAIRLGNNENIADALFKIRSMYESAKKLKPEEARINHLLEERKLAQDGLVKLLDTYEKYSNMNDRLEGLEALKKNLEPGSFLNLKLDAQIAAITNELEKIGNVNLDDFRNKMVIDHQQLFMALHFDTARKLQKLDSPKYQSLKLIFIDVSKDNIKDKVKLLRDYLRDNNNLEKFLEIFSVIISTNTSCTYLGDASSHFDLVMMDEAGQCNIANALIPICRGKQLMLVGDPQQLKPVIVLDRTIDNKLRQKYHIPQEYDYIDNSIYTTYTQVDIINNESMLRSHYRCNNKIIGFSNRKYYNNKLKCLSPSKEEAPLLFVDISKCDNSNFANKNVSVTDAKYVTEYIKKHPEQKIGVITPFVRQKECIEYFMEQEGIKNVSVGTVHAFQGDQQDVIIFSTAITNHTTKSTYNWIKNNRELINVAVSRAKDKLVMIANREAVSTLTDGKDDIKELCDYVNTKGECEITNVSPESFALGTRQMSTESEKVFTETIKHILGIINNNCFVRNEVPVKSVFTDCGSSSELFYKGQFDLVIYEKGYGSVEHVLAVVELNGPEHYSSDEVIRRDKQKEEICKRNKVELIKVRRDCARDYNMIKKSLVSLLGKR